MKLKDIATTERYLRHYRGRRSPLLSSTPQRLSAAQRPLGVRCQWTGTPPMTVFSWRIPWLPAPVCNLNLII